MQTQRSTWIHCSGHGEVDRNEKKKADQLAARVNPDSLTKMDNKRTYINFIQPKKKINKKNKFNIFSSKERTHHARLIEPQVTKGSGCKSIYRLANNVNMEVTRVSKKQNTEGQPDVERHDV